MISFELFLISKGYIKFRLNVKSMKYENANDHVISSMVNLDHRYVHQTDTPFIQMIMEGRSINDDDFSYDNVRKKEIIVGLHERGKPVTLIFPRPKIRVSRSKVVNGEKCVVIETENFDDSMNLVMSDVGNEQLFQAMFDPNVIFNYDLTDGKTNRTDQ